MLIGTCECGFVVKITKNSEKKIFHVHENEMSLLELTETEEALAKYKLKEFSKELPENYIYALAYSDD